MLRLRRVNPCLGRLLHGPVEGGHYHHHHHHHHYHRDHRNHHRHRDLLLDQLQACSTGDSLLAVVGNNKAKLTVNHVSLAVQTLIQFQKENPELLKTTELIKNHPQFLTLRVLAENKISLMDDSMLVDMLYMFLRLNVDQHDSLVQQLMSEAWSRLDRLPLSSLSKFAICLGDQQLHLSPLMGHITSIVDQKVWTIDNIRILSALMVSIGSLVSPRLRDALISQAELLLGAMNPLYYHNPRRVVQFLSRIRFGHRPLLDKCNRIFLPNVHRMTVVDINKILGLYHSLQFYNSDFTMAARQRLTELIETSTVPSTFTRLFQNLAPITGPDTRERLENMALLLAEELNGHQALVIAETLEEIQCRNFSLMKKIASVIQRNLHVYKTLELVRVTQTMIQLHYQNPEFYAELRDFLVKHMQCSILPFEVALLARVLSMVPVPRLDKVLIPRMETVVDQCGIFDLNNISLTVTKWVRGEASYGGRPSRHLGLLQVVNRCGLERLQTAERLDLLLEDIRYLPGEWFDEVLLEETMVALRRMMDQINWTNVADLATFLTRTQHPCPLLMERMVDVVIQDIHKIHPSSIYSILMLFSAMNCEPVKAEEFYDVCIQRSIPHITSLNPHILVFLAFALALVDIFPEELIKKIFTIEFLGKLDSQLETLPDSLNLKTRHRLMELNRAVCLQCPEFQVPWFHDHYCSQIKREGIVTSIPVHQQIHKMLSEVLDGVNRVRVGVVTPYYYTVDFECRLDRNRQPLPYSESSTLQMSDPGSVHWGGNLLGNSREDLPPGAERVAVDFLHSRSFCKYSHHVKGEVVMRQRHLEILGYRVVQIPHFEWNSMELSTPDAWRKYLKKKIYGEASQ